MSHMLQSRFTLLSATSYDAALITSNFFQKISMETKLV
jgi:hypothetical protein